MSKLIFEVEIQTYGESDEEEKQLLAQIRDAIESVVRLTEVSVGVFTKSEIAESD